MKNIKPIIVLSSILFVMILLIPALVVVPFADKEGGKLTENVQTKDMEPIDLSSPVDVPVYRSQAGNIEEIPLEEYIVGVVASEMPADFELEALKAQALTARTYVVRQMLINDPKGVPAGAIVSDTVQHQVYKSPAQLKEQWDLGDYEWKMEKIQKAVQATAGQILTYENEPIDASFFSTSNGFTENSEEYWSNKYPYLRSVESPWDTESKEFLDQTVVTVEQFEKLLGVKLANDGSVGNIVSRTTGNRVKTVQINGKELSGREVREALKLRSSDFAWERKGDQIVIQTKGYGHGVGMSQYGANGMAKEGRTHDQIVTHYYRGVEIASAEQFVTKLTAKQ